MKKTMIAALAALMFAGALSAAGDATSMSSVSTVIVIGEGSAPLPATFTPAASTGNSDSMSLTNQF